ncbi:hypothetical protein BGZ83_006477 [Gryganskiella cystojenkinii]|nr:hypothetical protein BGZ83_006477 [Gryganskiella cystojenkinii]
MDHKRQQQWKQEFFKNPSSSLGWPENKPSLSDLPTQSTLPDSQQQHHSHLQALHASEVHRRSIPSGGPTAVMMSSSSSSSSSAAHIPDDQRPARIKIVQQPLHARMCGFGEKDRRPVDPPPIVQLLLDENHSQHPAKRMLAQQQQQSRSDAVAASAAAALVGKKVKDENHDSAHENGEDQERKREKDGDDSHESEENDGKLASGSERVTRVRSESLKQEGSDPVAHQSSPNLGKRRRNGHKDEDGENTGDDNSNASDDENDDEGHRLEGAGEEELNNDPLFVLHVSLWSADGSEVRNMIATPGQSEPPKLTRILMGSLVVSPILLNNAEGVPGWYFSFPDLSIRTEGVYTLKFSLMRFGSFDFVNNEDGHASTLVAEEISQPFTVFSAKKFPGMTESTELSKAFAKQGLKIPIRNDLRARKADRD